MFGSEYVATLLPYGIMAIVNRDEWFVYNPETWKVGLGGAIGIALLSLSIFLITKKKENEKITNGMISLVIVWYACAFVFFLLAKINMEIYKIMAYGGLGLIAVIGLEVERKNFENKANQLEESLKEADKKLKVEQATKELTKDNKVVKDKKPKKVAID